MEKSPGSVRKVTYAEGIHGLTPSIGQRPLGPYNNAKGEQLTLTQKIESVDEENKTMTYSVVDGDILKLYKSYQATFTVSSKGDGTLVIYSGVYEKQNEQVPDPGEFTGIVSKTLYGLDAYLLQA
ncbi:MLP-like protein 423 [Dorcoceras hygrometricum]|uniref:MLP-like protein 423 n=1 Tax=Dorcoceras hygrometricum TaxID=472368 RepID=A0A2Z7B471_9LAMI|nr:MLP-like protein 423 [Dorcoceras hygrometricum]